MSDENRLVDEDIYEHEAQELVEADSLAADLKALEDGAEDYQQQAAAEKQPTPSFDFIYSVLYSKILVRRLSSAELTAQFTGIHKPEVAEELPCEAEVLVVGEGRLMPSGAVVPLRVRIGDRVLFNQHVGHDILIEGQMLTVLQEDEVAVIARRS